MSGVPHVFAPHAWVQAWDGTRWTSYDAALGRFDAGHIALMIGDGDPVILHLSKVMTSPGLAPREQALAGRRALMTLSFEEMERSIRDLLGRALSGGGFDPARDIEAITLSLIHI